MKVDSTMFYGRARRIEVVKKIIIVLVIILILIFLLSFLLKKVQESDQNVNFDYLRNYLQSKGYTCELIQKSGGKCYYEKDSSYKSFTRYDTGFIFLLKNNGYSIQIRHVKDTYEDIIFETNGNALPNLTYKKFTCQTKGNINDELDYCVTENGEELITEAYIGVIESSISELNSILNSSGYKVDRLVTDYVWEK